MPNVVVCVPRRRFWLVCLRVHTYIPTYLPACLPTYIHYITLHYITLHYTTLHYTTLHYITYHTLHYITLHYITLHYITLHCIALHYIALHCITLHYITLHTYIHCIHIYIYVWYPPPFQGPTFLMNSLVFAVLSTLFWALGRAMKKKHFQGRSGSFRLD